MGLKRDALGPRLLTRLKVAEKRVSVDRKNMVLRRTYPIPDQGPLLVYESPVRMFCPLYMSAG